MQVRLGDDVSDLKSALDIENDYLNNALKDIDEAMDILYREGYGIVSLTENTIVTGISLKSGVTYSITANAVDTPKGACYFSLLDGNGNVLVNNSINATTTTKTVTYTPNADKNNCYFTIKVTTASVAGTGVNVIIQDTNGKNKFEQLDESIEKVDDDLANVRNALLETWQAKNILPVLFQDSSGSGIEWTVNYDGTITAKGTASGLAYKQVSIVLPVGTYILNGCPNGSTTNGYRMTGFLQGDNATNITDAKPEMEFVSDGTTKFNVQLLVPNGTSITSGITFKPMIRNKAVYPYDDSYLPYGIPNVVNHETEYFGNAYGYKNYADIAWPSLTYNGIVWTNNGDGTIKATGTATAHAGITASVTLPAGNYAITGAPPGSTSMSYRIGIAYSGESTKYIYDISPEYKFTLSAETSVSVYLMMPNGTSVGEAGVVFKPLIRNTDIYPYDDTFCSPKTIYMPDTVGNISYRARSPWFGKKMNVIGDSIVQGVQNQAFANETAKELNLGVLRNYGIGGCCIAVTDYASQYTPVVSRWDEMDNDADIVFVHAGTNDYSQQVPLGDADSLDTSTFNGALNVIMNGLRVKYPTALVIFDSILSRYNDNSTSAELPIRTDQYRQAIEDRCNDHKFVFYDCYKYSGFDFVKDNNQSSGVYHVLSFDGLHPNAVGAKILGRKIAGFINWQ